MSNRLALSHLKLAVAAATLSLATAAQAVELDKSAVTYMTPDQFKWRDPTMQAATNQTILVGDPNRTGGIYVYINSFKPGRFGNPHYHPNDRYITVTRIPKGTFRIDHANKVHWDGTKEESGAYLIAGIGPATNIEVPKTNAAWSGGDPSALTILTPDKIQWQDNGNNKTVNLAGDPTKEGMYVQMLTWKKGNGSRPHYHPNDRFFLVLDGTWWVGTGTKWDPANLTIPMKAGTFVTHHAKGVHWDGANGPNQDADTTIIVFGMGPATNIPAPGAN